MTNHQIPMFNIENDDSQNLKEKTNKLIKGKTKNSRKTLQKDILNSLYFTSCALLLTILFPLSPVQAVCPAKCQCTDKMLFCVGQEISTFFSLPVTTTEVYLFNNNLSNIQQQTFRPLSNLKRLDLSGNIINDNSLWPGIFTQKLQLEHIDLSQNKLTKIKKSHFSGLPNLQRLYLQKNRISSIEAGSFNNLTKLVELKISNNRLRSFPEIRMTPGLLLIDASYNMITKLDHEAFGRVNLEKLVLGHNRLTSFQNIFDVVDRLAHLDISSNRLTAVPRAIRSLENLIALNISNNQIREIQSDTFKTYRRLKDLDLTNMQLTTLPEILPQNIILNFFRLGNNPWNCDCKLSWVYKRLSQVPIMFYDLENVKCASPSKVRGETIRAVGNKITCNGVKPVVSNPKVPVTSTTAPPRRKPTVNTCDVFICRNGGVCTMQSNFMPVCSCPKGFIGSQCQVEIYKPTPKTTTTTTTPSPPFFANKPGLMINPDSVTQTSVEIILPRVSNDLTLSIREKFPSGKYGPILKTNINPTKNMYTINQGLTAGRTYNICITTGSLKHDVLCGVVKMADEVKKEIPVVVPALKPIPTVVSLKTVGSKLDTVKEDAVQDERTSDVNAKPSSELGILYPALGAGCGVLIILMVLLLFFMCYRAKRSKMKKKRPQNNNTDTIYIPGSDAGTIQTRFVDMEMSPLTKHSSRGNSLKNGSLLPNGHGNHRSSNQNQQMPMYNQSRRVATPNSSTSSSSNSNCGTLPATHDNSYHYQPTQINGNYKNGGENVPFIPTSEIRGEFYRTPSQGSPTHALHAPHFDNEDMRPLMMSQHSQPSMPQYYPQEATPPMTYMPPSSTMPQLRVNYNPMHGNGYSYPPRTEVVYPVGDISTPQHQPFTSRSAFQPIMNQSTHTSSMTPASQCAPIMTHINTTHVMPDPGIGMLANGHLYQEGVA